MKRPWLLRLAALVVVVVSGAGCPPDTPTDGCAANSDCDAGAVCAAGRCVVVAEGEGDVGEGEGEGEGDLGEGEGEGDVGEGEGEGDPPPDPVFRLEADVVAPAGNGTVGNLRLSGGPVLNAPQLVLRGARFTVRGATVGGAP